MKRRNFLKLFGLLTIPNIAFSQEKPIQRCSGIMQITRLYDKDLQGLYHVTSDIPLPHEMTKLHTYGWVDKKTYNLYVYDSSPVYITTRTGLEITVYPSWDKSTKQFVPIQLRTELRHGEFNLAYVYQQV